MDRRRDSARARRICLNTHLKRDALGEFMICNCGCGQRFDPKQRRWRADHIRRWAEGGEDTPENLWPILERCDQEKKAPQDTREIAKGRRVRDAIYGVRRSQRPMPCGKRSKWRKKLSGAVVLRNP